MYVVSATSSVRTAATAAPSLAEALARKRLGMATAATIKTTGMAMTTETARVTMRMVFFVLSGCGGAAMADEAALMPAPHFMQNRCSSAPPSPHCGQNLIPPILDMALALTMPVC